jgi:hypothetical protein
VITGAAIAWIVVVPQRLNERTGDGSADRQPHLILGHADLDRPDCASRRIKSMGPVHEVPESRKNSARFRV